MAAVNKSQDAARPGTRLSVIRQRSLFAGAAALSLAAVGCGGGAKPVPPLSAELSFSAGSSVNVYRGEA